MAKIKAAAQDYDTGRLPRTRVQLFKDIYRNRLGLMLDLGLCLLLFCLPLMAVNMLVLAQSMPIDQALAKGELSAREAAVRLVQLRNAGNILAVPALVILALGLSGAANVVKNLVWQEGVLFRADFKQGIRSNWRCFCLTALLAGVLNYAAQYLYHVGFFESGAALELGLVAVLAAAALFALALPFVLVQSTLYNLSYFQKLSNGLLLSLRSFFPAAALVIMNVLPFGLLLIDAYVLHIFAMLLLPVLVLPALLLGDTLFVHSVLDTYINRAHFPEIYRKGLWSDADC